HAVCLAAVFFRASSATQGFGLIGRALRGLPSSLARLAGGSGVEELVFLHQPLPEVVLALALLLVVTLGPLWLAWVDRPGVGPLSWAGRVARSPLLRTVGVAAMFYLFAFHGAD